MTQVEMKLKSLWKICIKMKNLRHRTETDGNTLDVLWWNDTDC